MAKGVSDKIVFKPYDQDQIELFPPTAKELIPENHLVRIVSSVIDQLDLTILMKQYKNGGGASRYHPFMLLKVLIYGYLNNVCSSRGLAKQVRENIFYRWIAGCQQPDFRTINTFRQEKLSPIIHEIFFQVVKLLNAKGYVQLQNLFVDGTKIESRANRYTFVWRKSTENFDKKLDEKLESFVADAKEIMEKENIEFADCDLPEMGENPISSNEITEISTQLNQVLKKLDNGESDSDKKVKKNSGR